MTGYLLYSLVRRMMWRDKGLTHFGRRSSAALRGSISPVSKFLTVTSSKIS